VNLSFHIKKVSYKYTYNELKLKNGSHFFVPTETFFVPHEKMTFTPNYLEIGNAFRHLTRTDHKVEINKHTLDLPIYA
jgi:hypothetical protein